MRDMRAGFLSGDLPLIGDAHEVYITMKSPRVDVAKLEAVMGAEWLARFVTDPVPYVLVRKREDAE